MDRFYVTTPIFYVNARPHLGHAYTGILADTLHRFHLLMGQESYFLTGTDEHGDKIVRAAEKDGQTPREYADYYSGLFQELWPKLGVQSNDFIRTTQERHIQAVQTVLQKVYDSGDIYFGEYGGHYCFGCERFYTEKELVDGKCPQHGVAPEYLAEKNYFFRMSKYQDWLLEYIRRNPDFIRPERYRNEVVSLLESGALEDLCISRPKSRLTWGIELPFDPGYVCYVWFDALINYLTALEWPDGEKFKKFWPAANHLVAKDILKPHGVFWPTMLKAAGLEPYQHLNVHGYWLVKDIKMSKSLGNVVEPLELIDKYGQSAFRYFLLREMSFGSDASFSEEALVGRLNADLANDLGNLFSRALAMAHKFFDGVVPQPHHEESEDVEMKRLGRSAMKGFQTAFEDFRFSVGLEELWTLVRGLNKYIDLMKPWELARIKGRERLSTVMYVLLESMRKVAVHLWPVMPDGAVQMLAQLGLTFDAHKYDLSKELDTWGVLEPGTALAGHSNLFPRVDPARSGPAPGAGGKKTRTATADTGGTPGEGEAGVIGFEDFQKLDLRVGTVVAAAPHPDAERLLLVQVDLGETSGPRQVVAGIAEYYRPEDLLGRQVVVVANLKPRTLRKQRSQGMILAVKNAHGLDLLTASAMVTPGSKVS